MKIPESLLQKIKEAVNIVDIVGEHVVLKKSGANHSGLCPFHSERTPSFSVNEQKQLYHCYGCKKGGDLLSFVMEIHGITFPEAIEELAERGKIKLPKESRIGDGDPETERRRAEARERTATAYRLNRFVAMFYHNMLGKFPQAAHYFRSRGINDEIVRSFYLGAALPSWDALAIHLANAKAPLPLAAELGLIMESKKKDRAGPSAGYFDLFRNRAIFPFVDVRGRVAGFGGRILPGAEEGGSDGPNYLNSKESWIYQKSKLAYGFYQAQKHVRQADSIILVEGYFDVLALHAAGFQNVVGICGTSLTMDHLHFFKRFASKVIVLFDGDKAGVAATERAMELGLEDGQVLYGAIMPEGLDPDEILFHQGDEAGAQAGRSIDGGRERMRAILDSARPLWDARMEAEIRRAAEGPEARTSALKKMAGWLTKFQDPVGREVRMEVIQKELGFSRELLLQAMGRRPADEPGPEIRSAQQPRGRVGSGGQVRAPSGGIVAKRPAKSKPQANSLNEGERLLLQGLALGGEFEIRAVEARSKLPPAMTLAELFDYGPAQSLIQWVEKNSKDSSQLKLTPDLLGNGELDPQVRSVLTETWAASEPPFAKEDFQQALERLTGRLWARFSQRIKAALKEAEAKKDAGLHDQLLKEYLDVQRKMKEFTSFYDEA